MKNEKMLSEKSVEHGFIENIVYKNTTYVGEKGYTEVRFDFVNNTVLEITSKFNSEAVVDYAFKNNLKDLEDISKEELVGNSKVKLDLSVETFSELDRHYVTEYVEWLHLYGGHMWIRKANKETDFKYMLELEDYLKSLDPESFHIDEFEFCEDEGRGICINLVDYPNKGVNSLSEAIKVMGNIYKAIISFNREYGIDEYDIALFIASKEM